MRSNKKPAPFNASTIIPSSPQPPPDTIQHSSVLTESDKLPWPIPYRNVEQPEFKWKIVRPTNIPSSHQQHHQQQQHQNDTNQTVEVNEENIAQEIEMASNDSSHPRDEPHTHIYPPFTSEQSQSQSYHPYEFESVHSLSNGVNMPPTTYSPTTNTISDGDIYAQPIDHLNETITTTNHGHHTKNGEVHIEHINNE